MYCSNTRRVITKERESLRKLLKIESKLRLHSVNHIDGTIMNRTIDVLEEHM